MKLTLAHAILPARFNGSWVYLGHNYLRMRSWEKRLSGKQISMSRLISEEAESQRPHTLDWIRRQREANGDSLDWWMTNLAGRANLVTQFFSAIIQIAALKRWVLEQPQEKINVHVLCEDGFLLRAVEVNLRDSITINLKTGWWLGWLWDWIFYFARASYCLIRQVWRFFCHARMAKKTRPPSLDLPQGTVYLIHQCLDNISFLKEGPLACRYFTKLPTWLETKGKQIIRLPYFSSNVVIRRSWEQIYRRLRASNCLIPGDWLNTKDYLCALLDGCKSIFAIRYNVKFDKLDLCALISRERCRQFGDGFNSAQFRCYAPVLERWGKSLSKLVMIDNYEAQASEHVQIVAWRTRVGKPSKFIGYVNSLNSRDYLQYHTPEGEIDSKAFPDVIITTGSLGKSMLVEQGLPDELVQAGPALRQRFPSQTASFDETKRRGLLLLLSYKAQAVELLDKISKIAPWIYTKLGVTVIVKSHPMTNKAVILKSMGWKTLPDGWRWHDDEIQDVLEETLCAVSLSTSSVVDAVLAKCVPCLLTRSQGISFNSLDFLASQFPILDSIPDNQIQARLEEIFVSREEFFQTETLKVQECLLQGLNPVNDESMAVFG